jgi:hypothetical protein
MLVVSALHLPLSSLFTLSFFIVTNMLCRERRSWTAKEDQLLRDAVERGVPVMPATALPGSWLTI